MPQRTPALTTILLATSLLTAAACTGDDYAQRVAEEAGLAQGSPMTAVLACQRFVEKHVQGPRRARFPRDSSAVEIAPGRFRYASFVEGATAAGGSRTRVPFTCEVSKVSGGRQWKLESLTMR